MAPEEVDAYFNNLQYLKTDVVAMAQRKREDKRNALIDTFPGDSAILIEAFIYCGRLSSHSKEHIASKYAQLLSCPLPDPHQASLFATYYTSLSLVGEDVKARLSRDGKQEKKKSALGMLEQKVSVQNGRLNIKWEEALADGLKTMDDFMKYVERPVKGVNGCANAHCLNTPAIGKLLSTIDTVILMPQSFSL